jgi:uncharacterized protein (TIGR00290 family)
MTRPRVLLSWSTGKDAAWALHVLRSEGYVDVVGLLTTLNAAFDRVAMHGTRRALLEAQSASAGLPLITVSIPWPCTNTQYEAAIAEALEKAETTLGISHIAFGDLYLEDVRVYREAQLAGTGLTPLFPLWGIPTRDLACRMIDGGLQAYLSCVDPRRLPASFAGRSFDSTLLSDLPPGVDACGESGEFHTFAFDGPMFAHPIHASVGEVVERDGFVFADVTAEDVIVG